MLVTVRFLPSLRRREKSTESRHTVGCGYFSLESAAVGTCVKNQAIW